jgi:hypothetical protein
MTTVCLTPAKATATAAKPPSTTNTSRQPGRQRRTWFSICRTPSTLVGCRRGPRCVSGQQRAVNKGHAHTRRLQGTGPHSRMDTHFQPKQRMPCFGVERTASR